MIVNNIPIGINPETGEKCMMVPLELGYHVTTEAERKRNREYYEREAANERRKEMRWVACYHDPIRNITKDLSLTEAGTLIRLLPFLRFKSDGKLIADGKPLKQVDIRRIIGRNKANTLKILNRLEEIGVISKEKNGRANEYYISIEFHTYGQTKEGAVKFTKLYQYHMNELTKDLNLNEIGLLYKILPYFHYQKFYLCDNPDEDVEEGDGELEMLTREELADRIGHDVDTVTALVGRLQAKGVLLSTKSMNTVNYIVHPDVMYRQDTEDLEYMRVVRDLFAQHKKRKRR
jgi:predicted transcriptional regulator